MISKKLVVIISGVVSGALVMSGQIASSYMCGNYNGDCLGNLENLASIATPFVPLFFVSIVASFMQEEVFRLWIKFVYVWLPFSIFLIFISPQYGQGHFITISPKAGAFWEMVLVLIMVSALIFVFKSIAVARERTEKKTGV
ncbi:MAG TPA: hypothetical protein VMU27_02980 [Candidatus Paceibacterota bacterium]|nr:hypothetical protein [Candidatus Paceibacterota bacterium]